MEDPDQRPPLPVIAIVALGVLLTIVATCAALAEPTARWGASTATLEPCHAADACVTVINQLSAAPDIVAVALDADGLMVEVYVVMGAGQDPDRVQVVPPLGWIVFPGWADIPEGQALTFRLFAPMVG